MKNGFIKTVFLFYVLLIISPKADANSGETDVQKTVQQYIAELRRGVNVRRDDAARNFVRNRRIDKSVLSALTKELAVGTPDVRKKIVELLEEIGLELDPPNPNKFRIIRDHSIIRGLLSEGFAKDDAAASAAAAILSERCKPSDLAAFNDVYIRSLQQSKGDYLYLIAKAKTHEARSLVDNLVEFHNLQNDADDLRIVKITQAALGSTTVEDEFIAATYEAEKNAPPAPKNPFFDIGTAKDGKELAVRLGTLGLIGTRRSLSVACTYLRSPLKTYFPDHFERSVRYDALDAVLYNFPDERLEPTTTAEWAAAERFCTENIGAVFDGPTPDLPPDVAYPTPLPK